MNKLKFSAILNLIIFVMVAIGAFITLTGIKPVSEVYKATYGFSALKFFTVLSNFIAGIFSLVFAIFALRVLSGKLKAIPPVLYGLKLIFTTSLAVTFIVVACFLAPFIQTGYFSMYLNANFFFHFAVPVLSVVTLIFYESNDIKFRYVVLSLVPVVLYGIVYVVLALTHMEGGVVSPEYDWYKFMSSGTWVSIAVAVAIFAVTFFFAWLLRFLNHKTSDVKNSSSD